MFLDVKKRRSRSMIGSTEVAQCYRGNTYGVSRVFAGVALVCLAMIPGLVNAAAVLQYSEVGNDIVVTLSGSLDLSNTSGEKFNCFYTGNPCPDNVHITRGADISQLSPSDNLITNFYSGDKQIDAWLYQITGPVSATDPFGNGVGDATIVWSSPNFGDTGSSASNSDFFLKGNDGELYLEASYVSGAEMTATWTYVDTKFSYWGVTDPSEFVYTLAKVDPNGSTDTFTVRFGGATNLSAVPLPASVFLLGAGLGGFGLMGRLRRRKLAC